MFSLMCDWLCTIAREANRFPSSLIVFASITSDKITDLRREFSQCTELTQISHLSKVSGVKDVSSSCFLQTCINLNKPPLSLMCNSKNNYVLGFVSSQFYL